MANDELIERGGGCDEHGARASAAAPSATGALPGGGDGARVSGHDDGVERADINTKFESAGGNNAADFSVAEAALDFAAFVGQIATAVAADGFRFSGQLWICLL